MVYIENAKLTNTLFQKDTYSVKLFNTEEGRITCFGDYLPDNKNITYLLIGEWVNSAKYGKQFRVYQNKVSVSNTKDGIINFLSSGIIHGIGKKTAERIYDLFGDNSIEVLKESPRKYLKIKGISEKKLERIVDSYRTNVAMEETILKLSPYGFSIKQISTFYKKYKEDLMEVIEANPYDLCEFRGISFKMADRIGQDMGFTGMNGRRFYAALLETFHQNMQCGSVGITINELLFGTSNRRVEGLIDKLGLSQDVETQAKITERLIEYINKNRITYVKKQIGGQTIQYFYENNVKKIEVELAAAIREHMMSPCESHRDLDKIINRNIKDFKIALDQSQIQAIRNAFEHNISIITGGPGTGKTTICKLICQIAKELEPSAEITLLAPTGRAARRLSESTGHDAYTIHKRLCLSVHTEDREYDEEPEVIDGGTVIVDEFSMVDMTLAHTLFRNIENARIILVGDKDQLESVGAGCVLRDLLLSNRVPVVTLQYVHRQAGASTICENAELIRSGCAELTKADDFVILNQYEPDFTYMDRIEENMIQSYLKECEQYGPDNVILLAPFKKHTAGIYSLNLKIQEMVNPLQSGCKEMKGLNGMTFRPGDRVMQLLNDGDLANGDIGIVKSVFYDDNDVLTTKVLFENGCVGIYNSDNNEQITLAYASTIHKSQGSEYRCVIMCLTPFHGIMLKRNLIYTGITRAKEKVILYTCEDAIKRAVDNNSIEDRHTMLSYYLMEHPVTITAKLPSTEYQQLRLFA